MDFATVSGGFTSFAKARIYVEGPGRQISDKGITGFTEGKFGAKDGYFEFMFSPKEFTEAYTTKWAEGGDQSKTVYKGYNRDNLTLEAIFDSYSTPNGPKDVRENRQGVVGGDALTNALTKASGVIYGVKHLKSLLLPTDNPADSTNKVPPILVFQWGSFNYRGHLETLNIKYTMFLPDGVPVRAKVNMVLKAFMTDKESVSALGHEACRKVRTVIDGMRLDLVADSEMKDPAAWKEIARLNNISDPMNFPTRGDIGKQLLIPDLEAEGG